MNAADRLLEDDEARRRALDTATSFIVEAPAGAGKTELLTQRYLALLAVVNQPEEVLALTFTNKAATEMRDRILDSLDRAALGECPAAPHKKKTFDLANEVLERNRQRGWQLLSHPGRLRITTLDALCASLARQMPYLSRFGAQPGVCSEADAHYQSAARRTLDQLEGGDDAAETVAAALAFMDNDAGRLERLIVAMLGRREQWLHQLGRLDDPDLRHEVEAGFALLIGGEVQAAAERLDAFWQARLMPLARFAASQVPDVFPELLAWTTPLTADLADLPRWQAVARLVLTGEGTPRKALNKNCGFPAGEEFADQKKAMSGLIAELAGVPGLVDALARLPGLPPPDLADADWATVVGFGRLLRLAAAQLWLVFQENGEVDFAEISIRAALALGDEEAPTDLAQSLDYRISHLLVDEFQDTSPLQVELLAKLTRGWQPGDGRTLFLVGDPMQSIYRFRKAEVGLFLQVRAEGIGDIRLFNLRLCRNNRSYPAVVDWVNATFPAIFPAADERASGAVRYAASAATKDADPASVVQFHPVLAGAADDADALEARQVLALIQAARRADGDKARIAILVRARKHLDALVAAIRLEAPDLRYQAVEIESLADRQHIQDLLSLQQALWHRADRVHWLAVLRAPWCGLTLADLHALAGDDRVSTVWQLMHEPARLARLSADGQARLGHVRAVLEAAFAARGRQHPRRWLEGVWLMLGGAATLRGDADLSDIDAFFALVDELAGAGLLDGPTLLERAGELFAPPDPLAPETVQMMTIHKSKGLEFDTVILPGLHRNSGQNDQPLLLWDTLVDGHGEPRLLVAPLPRRGGDKEAPSAYRLLGRLEQRRSEHEDARLLYVGVTRAIRRLHLVGVVEPKPDSKERLGAPRHGTLLALLWTTMAQAASLAALDAATPPDSAAPGGPGADFTPQLIRLRRPAQPAELVAPTGTGADSNPPAALASTLNLAAAVGTLVHRCLQLIAGDGCAAWPAERIAGQGDYYRRWLAARGFDAAAAAAGAAETIAALQTTLASERGRWLLAGHSEGDAEQGWSSCDEGGVSSHVIDRIFIADGVRWIVDYKTLRPGEAPLDLAAAARGHRAQLERYASLFADDPTPTRLAIFFPLQGELVELPAGDD